MKNKILLVFTMFFNSIIFGQCENQSIMIDGIRIKQYNVKPFGNTETKQLGYSINEIDNQINLLFTIRFKYEYETLNKKVSIYLSNGKNINLEAQKVGKDYIGGSNIAHMNFILNQNEISLLKNSSINKIFINNETINYKLNPDHISILLNCK